MTPSTSTFLIRTASTFGASVFNEESTFCFTTTQFHSSVLLSPFFPCFSPPLFQTAAVFHSFCSSALLPYSFSFPVIACFFSPDPYVQMPDFTQNFNRYSYALNNPLKYTDPSGELLITFLVNAIRGAVHGEGFWKSGGQALGNHFKIFGGLFISDKNKSGGGQFWEVLSRFTWQGLQTAVGHLYAQFANTVGQVDKVSYKAGATAMSGIFWGTGSAITIGSYIHGISDLEADPNNSLFQHEYGHYLQSQGMGPAYLTRVGIPSILSNGNHDFHPAEQDANRRAFLYFNEKIEGFYKSEDDMDNPHGWDFYYNPLNINGTGKRGQYVNFKDALSLKYLNNIQEKAKWYDYLGWIVISPPIDPFTWGFINAGMYNR